MASIDIFSRFWSVSCLLILFTISNVDGDAYKCTGLPESCTCNVTEFSVSCENDKGMREFPTLIASAMHLHFKNVSIEIIDDVPYNDRVSSLSVTHCGTRLVRDGAFSPLSGLKYLNLGYNEISSLRSSTFTGLNNLTTLILSHNPLFRIKQGTFVGNMLPQLQHLYLSYSDLYEVEYLAFDKLSSLTTLAMANNHLKEMPQLGCMGDSLTNLRTFELTYNEIDHVPKSDCKMPAMQDLYLTHNRIEMLNVSFLGGSGRSLQQLHLSYNWISSVHPLALRELHNLTLLDLSNNRLSLMEYDAVNWNKTETVMIHDNPWDCSCVNHWLVDTIPVAKHNDEHAVRCGSPAKVFNKSVTAIDQDVFTEDCHTAGGSHGTHSAGRVAGIVMGVLFGIVGLFACTVVCYRVTTRRASRAPRNANDNNPSQGLSPRRSGGTHGVSQSYARMQDDPTFEFEGETPTPTWDNSQMPTWDTDPPLNNHHSNYKL